MIRRRLVLAAALGLAACDAAPTEQWPEPSPALWEVTGEHGERAWLFGTIHALPDGAEWRTPEFEQAFADADLLMVEIGNLGDSSEAAKVFDRFARSQGLPALSVRVPAADRPALAALMERAGVDDADFWDTETWAAALILAGTLNEGEPENGVDRALLGAGKPVEPLETFAAQFSRFDGLAEAQQRTLLADVARDAQREHERVEDWLTGDLDALDAELGGSFLRDPALRRSLLDERNDHFTARVVTTIERGREPFVAVGAAHMIGPGGLPAQLAARGYTVARIQ